MSVGSGLHTFGVIGMVILAMPMLDFDVDIWWLIALFGAFSILVHHLSLFFTTRRVQAQIIGNMFNSHRK